MAAPMCVFDSIKSTTAHATLTLQHTIVVITDGEASDKAELEKVIREASHKIPRDECLAISFIQVGRDNGARRFLKKLDDDLNGCKFDIVDTKVCNLFPLKGQRDTCITGIFAN